MAENGTLLDMAMSPLFRAKHHNQAMAVDDFDFDLNVVSFPPSTCGRQSMSDLFFNSSVSNFQEQNSQLFPPDLLMIERQSSLEFLEALLRAGCTTSGQNSPTEHDKTPSTTNNDSSTTKQLCLSSSSNEEEEDEDEDEETREREEPAPADQWPTEFDLIPVSCEASSCSASPSSDGSVPVSCTTKMMECEDQLSSLSTELMMADKVIVCENDLKLFPDMDTNHLLEQQQENEGIVGPKKRGRKKGVKIGSRKKNLSTGAALLIGKGKEKILPSIAKQNDVMTCSPVKKTRGRKKKIKDPVQIGLSSTHSNSASQSTDSSSSNGSSSSSSNDGGGKKIGIYSPKARRERILRYHEKRKKRVFSKQIKYDCRKRLAATCPRVKGRFVKRSALNLANMKNTSAPQKQPSASTTSTTTVGAPTPPPRTATNIPLALPVTLLTPPSGVYPPVNRSVVFTKDSSYMHPFDEMKFKNDMGMLPLPLFRGGIRGSLCEEKLLRFGFRKDVEVVSA